MYHCTNCGAELEALCRRYCPSVLKLLKCDKCGLLADKYIEYDPAIILIDLILFDRRAYHHLLFNSDLKFCWKLLIVLWLLESLRNFCVCKSDQKKTIEIENIFDSRLDGRCNFYLLLLRTALAFSAFIFTVVFFTEILRCLTKRKSSGYSPRNLIKALIIGASGKFLGLLEIVWWQSLEGPHFLLIQSYTFLCLLTAYTVVCKSGKPGSSIILAIGLVAYNCAFDLLSPSSTLSQMLQSV